MKLSHTDAQSLGIAKRVNIVTIHPDNPQEGQVKTINWRDSSDRKWLQSHMHWAVMNSVVVTIEPAKA